jgi:t-SNARE complex subunit (syntaxin)
MQDKQIIGVEKNLDDGHEKVMNAKKQLELGLEKSKNQNKRMGIFCLALFVIVVVIFLMLFGNPFKSDD